MIDIKNKEYFYPKSIYNIEINPRKMEYKINIKWKSYKSGIDFLKLNYLYFHGERMIDSHQSL
jgi:hypothetical protein